MKSGIFLLQQNGAGDDERAIDDLIQDVLIAERQGMDALLLSEHHFDDNCAYVDPTVFAGVLAARTSRIEIGFAVLQTSLYQPLRLAEHIALLDNVSKGRVFVGLGRGSLVNTHEYEGFGISQESAQERLEEIEKILIQCWSGKPVSHQGKYWTIDIPPLRPSVRTKPHPRILRSAVSDASIASLARQGRPALLSAQSIKASEEDNGIAVVRVLQHKAGLFRRTMKESGYSEEETARVLADSWGILSVIVADTDKEALENGIPYVVEMMRYRSGLSEQARGRYADQPTAVVCGSPSTVRDRLAPLADLGLGGIAVKLRIGSMPTDFLRRSSELYTKEVLPALKETATA